MDTSSVEVTFTGYQQLENSTGCQELEAAGNARTCNSHFVGCRGHFPSPAPESAVWNACVTPADCSNAARTAVSACSARRALRTRGQVPATARTVPPVSRAADHRPDRAGHGRRNSHGPRGLRPSACAHPQGDPLPRGPRGPVRA